MKRSSRSRSVRSSRRRRRQLPPPTPPHESGAAYVVTLNYRQASETSGVGAMVHRTSPSWQGAAPAPGRGRNRNAWLTGHAATGSRGASAIFSHLSSGQDISDIQASPLASFFEQDFIQGAEDAAAGYAASAAARGLSCADEEDDEGASRNGSGCSPETLPQTSVPIASGRAAAPSAPAAVGQPAGIAQASSSCSSSSSSQPPPGPQDSTPAPVSSNPQLSPSSSSAEDPLPLSHAAVYHRVLDREALEQAAAPSPVDSVTSGGPGLLTLEEQQVDEDRLSEAGGVRSRADVDGGSVASSWAEGCVASGGLAGPGRAAPTREDATTGSSSYGSGRAKGRSSVSVEGSAGATGGASLVASGNRSSAAAADSMVAEDSVSAGLHSASDSVSGEECSGWAEAGDVTPVSRASSSRGAGSGPGLNGHLPSMVPQSGRLDQASQDVLLPVIPEAGDRDPGGAEAAWGGAGSCYTAGVGGGGMDNDVASSSVAGSLVSAPARAGAEEEARAARERAMEIRRREAALAEEEEGEEGGVVFLTEAQAADALARGLGSGPVAGDSTVVLQAYAGGGASSSGGGCASLARDTVQLLEAFRRRYAGGADGVGSGGAAAARGKAGGKGGRGGRRHSRSKGGGGRPGRRHTRGEQNRNYAGDEPAGDQQQVNSDGHAVPEAVEFDPIVVDDRLAVPRPRRQRSLGCEWGGALPQRRGSGGRGGAGGGRPPRAAGGLPKHHGNRDDHHSHHHSYGGAGGMARTRSDDPAGMSRRRAAHDHHSHHHSHHHSWHQRPLFPRPGSKRRRSMSDDDLGRRGREGLPTERPIVGDAAARGLRAGGFRDARGREGCLDGAGGQVDPPRAKRGRWEAAGDRGRPMPEVGAGGSAGGGHGSGHGSHGSWSRSRSHGRNHQKQGGAGDRHGRGGKRGRHPGAEAVGTRSDRPAAKVGLTVELAGRRAGAWK